MRKIGSISTTSVVLLGLHLYFMVSEDKQFVKQPSRNTGWLFFGALHRSLLLRNIVEDVETFGDIKGMPVYYCLLFFILYMSNGSMIGC